VLVVVLVKHSCPVAFSEKGSMFRTLVVALVCVASAAAISHEAEGSGIGSLYPEGWRMIDRFAGFRYECTRKGK
jgi:hypothetical protein